jgi:hypothetical protein
VRLLHPIHCLHTSAYVSIRQHTSAYVSIRQHTSACASSSSDPLPAGVQTALCQNRHIAAETLARSLARVRATSTCLLLHILKHAYYYRYYYIYCYMLATTNAAGALAHMYVLSVVVSM